MEITTAIVDSSTNDEQREVKVQQFGPKTAIESSPYGIDSNPLKGMTAVFSESSESGEQIIIGYINEKAIAEAGETRIYCDHKDGFIYLKKNGSIEIGGSEKNLVKYQDLNQKLLQMVQDLNQELIKIASGISTAGGSYVPDPIQIDISSAITENIKVK